MTINNIIWFLDGLLRGHPDQTSEGELIALSGIAKGCFACKQNIMALEIGSWMGCSTVAIGRAVKAAGGKLVCVDSWRGTPLDDLNWISRMHNVYLRFWQRMIREGLQDTVIPMRGNSRDVLPLLQDGSFDLVYIDGDHSFSGVNFDITQAKRLIKPDGKISGHDFVKHKTIDVIPAVTEAFEHFGLYERIWVGL